MANNFNDKVMYVEPNYTGAYYEDDRFGNSTVKYELAPDLSDYCIAVDLVVECKGRTIGGKANNGDDVLTMSWTSSSKENNISFHKGTTLHFNGKDNSDGYINALTTSYLDTYYLDIVENGTNEMFGITSIDIQYNNYFVPEVTIEFVDVKGVSLFAPEELRHSDTQDGVVGFAREDVAGSFFKSFFSFPYPKYSLMVKGFYGRPVVYELTCSDFRAKFDSNTGNFGATATFIGYAYSLLTDITMNCLLVAPYSDYVGKSYWENKLTSTFKVYDPSGNATEMPTLVQLLGKIEKARTQEIKMSQDNPLYNEKDKLTQTTTALNAVSDAYMTYINTLKNIHVGDRITTYQNKMNIFLMEEKDVTITNGIDEATNQADAAFNILNTKINDFSYISGSKLSSKPDDYSKMKSELLFKKDDITGLYSLNTSHSQYSNFTDDVLEMLNNKLNEINQDASHYKTCYASVIKDNGFTDAILNIQKVNNQKITENEKAIQSYRENLLANVLGFKPSVENIMRIIMAHFETYMHMIINVADTIDKNPRTMSSLGLNSLYSDVNINKKDVPPFPKCTKLNNGKVEDDWLGLYAHTPEVDLVHGLLNGASMTNALIESIAANTIEQGFITNIPYPYMLSDLNNDENVFSEFEDWGNMSDIVGHIGLRMMNTLGLIPIRNQNDSALTEALAKADAKNFVKFNPRPNDLFLSKLKGNAFNENMMINILLNTKTQDIQNYKKNNAWAWDGQNNESEGLFENNYGQIIFNNYRVFDEKKKVVNYISPLSSQRFNDINIETSKNAENECQVPSDLTNYITATDKRSDGDLITENDNIFNIIYDLSRFGNIVNQFANSDDESIKSIPDKLNMVYDKSRYEDMMVFSDSDENGFKKKYNSVRLVPFQSNRLINPTRRDVKDYENENVFNKGDGWFENYPMDCISGETDGKLVEYERENIDEDAILENFDALNDYTVVQFYGFTNSSKSLIYVTNRCSLFAQYGYYLQSSAEQKAFLFLSSMSSYVSCGEIVDRFVKYEYPFEYIPKLGILYIGSLLWRYDVMNEYEKTHNGETKEALNIDGNFNITAEKDIPMSSALSQDAFNKLLNELRTEVRNKIKKEFVTWANSDFTAIRNAYELKFKNGSLVTPNYVKWFGAALDSSNGFDNGKKVGDMLDYESEETLSQRYINLEDYLTKTFDDNFFTYYMSIKKCDNTTSMRMFGFNLYNRENTEVNNQLTRDLFRPCLIVKGCRYLLNSDATRVLSLNSGTCLSYMRTFVTELKNAYSSLTEGLVTNSNGTPHARITQVDVNFKIALYNYCKIVYDRWVAGENNYSTWDLENFFEEYFYFIDAYYNRIGQIVTVNMDFFRQKLLDSQSQKAYSMLSFITDTLGDSRINFVCVQNFADLSNREMLEDMFRPIPFAEMPTAKVHPDFVSIYTYEPSRHLNTNGEYEDDSFMLDDALGYPEAIKSKNDSSGYKIPAFGVAYGKLYQSYFQDIQVSMESPIVTEQVIKAQLMLCNQDNNQRSDNGNNGMFIGQDLYTIYSNNSYTCTVKMLGCAWVQPLMYFTLLNVPMFKGSYLIQSVTHHIEAGQMYTTFMGVRMAKTSTPLVDDYYYTETNKGEVRGIGANNTENDYLNATINNNCPYKAFPVKGEYQGEPIISKDEYERENNPLPKYPHYKSLREAICSTVYAEAGNQGSIGMKLVAAVIMNRYARAQDWTKVLYQPQVATGKYGFDEIPSSVKDDIITACDEVCLNGMCSSLIGERTEIDNAVEIYRDNINTHERTKSDVITLEHLQKLGAYCTTDGYGPRTGTPGETIENDPTVWRSAEYILHHKGHVFTGQDKSKQSLYWKETSKKTKNAQGVSETAQGLFDAISKTVEYTPSLKCNLTMKGRGNQMIITSTDKAKMSVVFDAILNTYYTYILKLFWIANDALASNPDKIYIEVRDGEDDTPIIAIAPDGTDYRYTPLKTTDYDQLSTNFIVSLHKKYGDIADTTSYKVMKNECTNFAKSGDSDENEIRELFSAQQLIECPRENDSNDSAVENLPLSDNGLIKKCVPIQNENATTRNMPSVTWKNIVESKNGKWGDVNIIGVRSKKNYNGQISNNQFNDACVICYGDKKMVCEFTTVPGLKILKNTVNSNGAAILQPGYYEAHTIGYHKGQYKAVVQRKGNVNVYRDNNKDDVFNYSGSDSGMFGINIHKSGNPSSTYVNNWSAGCQVFKKLSDFNKFMKILQDNGINETSTIGYTLILEDDLS